MHKALNKYISAKKWLITEDSWEPIKQTLYETLFTLGNGFIGSRGILEEIPYDCYQGTYISGIFDSTGAQTTELVNMPDPINFKIIIDGEKLDVVGMDVIAHKRILDMRTGALFRRSVLQDSKKRKYDYSSVRFFSMDSENLAVMKIILTPLDAEADITIETTIDTSITNRGVLTEGRKKHTETVELTVVDNVRYRRVQTYENKIQTAYAFSLSAKIGSKKIKIPERTYRLHVKKDQVISFEKYISIYTSFEVGQAYLKDTSIRAVKKAQKEGFDVLFDKNKAAWNKKWKIANINIKGDAESDKVLRFNIYHLLIAAREKDGRSSVAARALSSEGYRGHVFWDTEIFMFPFFAYTNPKIAKNMLMYRYNRLGSAREIAKEKGYKGAMFPWESADTGKEATPTWYKDLDGSVIRIRTNDMEHHITSDVAYAVSHYFNITGDEKFIINYGLEIMFETARFWASRAEYNKKTKTYDIKNIIGPDEFHEGVSNNAYTNIMAKWNVLRAIKLYRQLKSKYPKEIAALLKNLEVTKDEIRQWASTASSITPPKVDDNNVIEQFKGYFKKRKIKIKSLDANYMPYYPYKLSLNIVNKTQLVKQADVVMLLYLLSDHFTLKQKISNYKYYNSRTLHKSSLSPAVYSLMALEAQDDIRAFQYFSVAANGDLKDIHGNPGDGIHAASLGGTWQAAVNGFAGIRLRRKILNINPRLPAHWREFEVNLYWKGRLLSIKESNNKVMVYIKSRKKDFLELRIFGSLKKITANKRVTFYRKKI